jgi:hypothetical protein
MDALHQCKLHERDKKSVYIYTPVLLWFLHGIGTNNGGHHVAIMAKCSLTHITCPRKPLNHPSEFCSGSYKLYWGKKKRRTEGKDAADFTLFLVAYTCIRRCFACLPAFCKEASSSIQEHAHLARFFWFLGA